MNSYVASDISELVEKIANIDKMELSNLGNNAYELVNKKLTMDNMADNFCRFIDMFWGAWDFPFKNMSTYELYILAGMLLPLPVCRQSIWGGK